MFSGGSDNAIIKTELQTGAFVCKRIDAHSDHVWKLSIAPDYTFIASINNNENVVKLWNSDLEPMQSLEHEHEHEDGVWSVDISPDSTMIASGVTNSEVKVWKKGWEGRGGLGA